MKIMHTCAKTNNRQACPMCREMWRRCVDLLINRDPHREVSANYARMYMMPDWFEYPDWSYRKCSDLGKKLERWLEDTEPVNILNSATTGGDVDDIKPSAELILRAKDFLRELPKTIPLPYIGVSYNGHIVMGWIIEGNRIDLEFYENGTTQGSALVGGKQSKLSTVTPHRVTMRLRKELM